MTCLVLYYTIFRTATVRAATKVETISLHKLDYDRFIKDIQASEKREDFHVFRECKLFRTWNRARIEKYQCVHSYVHLHVHL